MSMSFESIRELLKTVRYYNTVNIVQSFYKGDEAYIVVKCVKNTRTLEVTYIETQTVEHFECPDEAALAIYESLNLRNHSQTS
jgi:hypothetical protein